MNSQLAAASIIAHLGGDDFLAGLGARNFVVDDTHFSFTLIHDNPKGVHSVTISKEPDEDFKVICFGQIRSDSFHLPVVGTAKVTIPENLARAIGELTGIDVLWRRHF